MSEPAFVPAPWEYKAGHVYAAYVHIADVYGYQTLAGAANGRVITAAPELYAACATALETAKSWHKFHTGTDIQCDELCAIIPQLEAAIAKAGGAAACPSCNGMRVRVYPGTPLGHTEICRECGGKGEVAQ